MKIKTSELKDQALDWAVAKCDEYKQIHISVAWKNKHGAWGNAQVMVTNEKNASYTFSPSTYWSQGGPIIEREKIETQYWPATERWSARVYDLDSGERTIDMMYGSTPLIAAMRCFVASKLGNEIDIPEELL